MISFNYAIWSTPLVMLPTKWKRMGRAALATILIVLFCFIFQGLWTSFILMIVGALSASNDSPTPAISIPDEPGQKPSCDDHNWSAANVCWTLLSIIVPYVLKPRGSLHCLQAYRVWRVSPIFALAETISIWIWIIQGLMVGRSMRATCTALLAARVTMSRPLGDFEGFPRPQRSYCEAMILDLQIRLWRYEPRVMRFVIGDSIDIAELTANNVQPERSQREYQDRVWNNRLAAQESLERYLPHDLDSAIYTEKDFWIRAVVDVLMLLQVVKLSVVAGAGFLRFIGYLYTFCFSTVEFLDIVSGFPAPPHDYQTLEARSLWSHLVFGYATIWISETTPWGLWGKTMDLNFYVFWSTAYIAMLMHAMGIGYSIFFKSITLVSALTSPSHHGIGIVINGFVYGTDIVLMWITIPTAIVLSMLPICVLWLRRIVTRAWERVSSQYSSGTTISRDEEGTLFGIELALLVPGSIAFWQFLSIVLAIAGVNYLSIVDITYRCWETTKPGYYDRLG
ncbi:hypothetical protein LTR84_005955 [Exophiala bonariae]|uniref:Wax synthase domain-containing protein n=1 Tax=Exophiala bonariae TaxID=1690606 RepID=A0AAV9N3N4_9EURO|nr:hypothetical protein LTR84_005955 [Exophiala bonariae]